MSELRYLYRVLINPDFYDDNEDRGYYVTVWAKDDNEAEVQAVAMCCIDNDRDDDSFEYQLWICERDENVPPRQS